MSNLDDVLAMLKDKAMAEPAPDGVEKRHEHINLDGPPVSTTHVILEKDCVWCKGDTIITMLFAKANDWRSGGYVQNIWPNASEGDRETLISGSHSVCFDEGMPDD